MTGGLSRLAYVGQAVVVRCWCCGVIYFGAGVMGSVSPYGEQLVILDRIFGDTVSKVNFNNTSVRWTFIIFSSGYFLNHTNKYSVTNSINLLFKVKRDIFITLQNDKTIIQNAVFKKHFLD